MEHITSSVPVFPNQNRMYMPTNTPTKYFINVLILKGLVGRGGGGGGNIPCFPLPDKTMISYFKHSVMPIVQFSDYSTNAEKSELCSTSEKSI